MEGLQKQLGVFRLASKTNKNMWRKVRSLVGPRNLCPPLHATEADVVFVRSKNICTCKVSVKEDTGEGNNGRAYPMV